MWERKFDAYLAGAQQFHSPRWEYNETQPNLTLVWMMYTKDGQLVGRGGLQLEDECYPHMTEPFEALLPDFWGRGIAAAFFKKWLEFFDRHAPGAPMRILSMPPNPASIKITNMVGLTGGVFTQVGSRFQHPEWNGVEYDAYERRMNASPPKEMF